MARTPRTPGTPVEIPENERAIEQTPAESPADDLPNAIDIDAHKIAAPVLTKQGWVCPADKPNPRAL